MVVSQIFLCVCACGVGGVAQAGTVCIVQVRDPATSEPIVAEFHGVVSEVLGLPGPVYRLPTSKKLWIVGEDRKPRLYDGFLPYQTFLDSPPLAEPWSGRTVALSGMCRISAIAKSDYEYAEIPNECRGRSTWQLRPLLERHVTLALGPQLEPQVVGDQKLRLWPAASQLQEAGVNGVLDIGEFSSLGALAVIDQTRRLWISNDEKHWTDLGIKIGSRDYGEFVDVSKTGLGLWMGQDSVIAVRRNRDSGSFWAKALQPKSHQFVNTWRFFAVSRLFGEAFFYGQTSFFDFGRERWLRIGSQDLEEIPNSPLGQYENIFGPSQAVFELFGINKLMVQSAEGLSLYDGHSFSLIPNSMPSTLGRIKDVYDLPSISRVVVDAEHGVFEVTKAGEIRELPSPLGHHSKFVDWPRAGAALFVGQDGLYVVEKGLAVEVIPWPQSFGRAADIRLGKPNARTGDVPIYGKDRIALAVSGSVGVGRQCDPN